MLDIHYEVRLVVTCKGVDRQTMMRYVSVKTYVTTIRQGRNQLIIVNCNESVGVLEVAESIGLVNIASISQSGLSKRTLAERVWSQEEGVQLIGGIENEDTEGIVVRRIAKGNTTRYNAMREVEV